MNNFGNLLATALTAKIGHTTKTSLLQVGVIFFTAT